MQPPESAGAYLMVDWTWQTVMSVAKILTATSWQMIAKIQLAKQNGEQ